MSPSTTRAIVPLLSIHRMSWPRAANCTESRCAPCSGAHEKRPPVLAASVQSAPFCACQIESPS
eukprot:CAMPEP_0115861014 /NCGR_PEP_ID=MMETSP0287-20121206/17432_1 /TAXON_ID=412157 /ORGANISM="Chrysochromulina rotalis, Strain UIO044" /LENGTH=63 /DNA_ID=CAMNT_0003315371 /DNA_START=275 /DNA_END=463 /DNA_ORIENTATION=-